MNKLFALALAATFALASCGGDAPAENTDAQKGENTEAHAHEGHEGHNHADEAPADPKAAADEAEAAYFAKIAETEGIQKTESGIYYEVLTEGTGAQPTAQSTVKTHYHGTTTDGNVFDSSVERGKTAEFPVGGVIKGWQEILPMMKTGGKWRIHVPYALAYGAQSPSPKIPPYSTLIFEVELFEVK